MKRAVFTFTAARALRQIECDGAGAVLMATDASNVCIAALPEPPPLQRKRCVAAARVPERGL